MLLRRALPVRRQSSAHLFPIYEIGSKVLPFEAAAAESLSMGPGAAGFAGSTALVLVPASR